MWLLASASNAIVIGFNVAGRSAKLRI